MELKSAATGLSALAHEGRLATFRMLVQAGAGGLASGEIARRLDVPANSLSANLKILDHAGLVSARRHGRSIIYRAGYDRMAALLGYLMEDCCGGAPSICGPLAEVLTRASGCRPASALAEA